jgi:hypothetical protein
MGLVWVASYPRSGNTLTLLVLRDVFGIGRIGSVYWDGLGLGPFPQGLPPAMDAAPWAPCPELRRLESETLLEELRARPESYFVKTHRRSEASDPGPALYIVRDGRDAIVSHAHFVEARDTPRFRNKPFARRVAELIHPGIPAVGAWSDNVAAWRERQGPTAIVRFEDLIHDPTGIVADACERLDVALPEASGTLPSFGDTKGQGPTFFRKGIVGGWQDDLAPDLHERFWRYHGSQMKSLGYA